jgi:hypothetical protein
MVSGRRVAMADSDDLRVERRHPPQRLAVLHEVEVEPGLAPRQPRPRCDRVAGDQEAACCGHGSSSTSWIVHGSAASFLPWRNQSCTWNWIHAAASRFSVVAGLNLSRVSSSRLTVRGFGSRSFSGGSG